MSDDFSRHELDLGGMRLEDARNYVISYIAALNKYRRDIASSRGDLDLWEGRIKLAHTNDRPDLALQAENRADELRGKLVFLEGEEAELRRKVGTLKVQLKMLKNRPEKTVDADLLLAQLEQVAGKKDTTLEELKDTEATLALEELKKKMDHEES
jgi:phage shock protein A